MVTVFYTDDFGDPTSTVYTVRAGGKVPGLENDLFYIGSGWAARHLCPQQPSLPIILE